MYGLFFVSGLLRRLLEGSTFISHAGWLGAIDGRRPQKDPAAGGALEDGKAEDSLLELIRFFLAIVDLLVEGDYMI